MNKTKKTYLYPIKIEAHKEGGFHAKCHKLQGAWADGDSVQEAVDNLQDVIKHILEYHREYKKKMFIPPAIPTVQARLVSNLNVAIYA